jgi:hypothetical protein
VKIHGILCLASLLLLGACRFEMVVEKDGAILAANAGIIYRNGEMIDISEDYAETFWPVPAPGNQFAAWQGACNKIYGECRLVLEEQLWSLDIGIPLKPRFFEDYIGPLEFESFSFSWSEIAAQVTIPISSVIVNGQHPINPELRLYVASRDLQTIIPAETSGGEYVFKVINPELGPEDLWVFATARDRAGIIASVAHRFNISPDALAGDNPPQLFAYDSSSPYQDDLVRCVTADDPFSICDFQTLPLIGQTTNSPTLQDVLNHTVVSHSWMGERFAQVLPLLPNDILLLMRGVTAIVISSHVRPSYYSGATGVIHLDPQTLWLSNAEKSTISQEEDFRSEFSDLLNFLYFWEYLKGFAPASESYALDDNRVRSIDQIVIPLGALLFHELAHANDAIAPARHAWIDPADTMLEAIPDNQVYGATTQLYNSQPLRSNLLYGLGQVMFQGSDPNSYYQSVSAEMVGLTFESDDANDPYAYSVAFEDTAMLFEEVMMKFHFNVDRTLTFLDRPANELTAQCDDFIVRWGQRNRIAQARVRSRAEFVLGSLLDEVNTGGYFSGLSAITRMPVGGGYCSTFYQPQFGSRANTSAATLGQQFSRQALQGQARRPPLIPGQSKLRDDAVPVQGRRLR